MTNSRVTLSIPQEHPCFADHFPGAPLVPGALLLAWITQRLQAEHQLVITQIRQAKFVAPVLPGMQLEGELVLRDTRLDLDLCAGHTVIKLQCEFTREHA